MPINAAKYIMEPMPIPFQIFTTVRMNGQYFEFMYTSTGSPPKNWMIWFIRPVLGLRMA